MTKEKPDNRGRVGMLVAAASLMIIVAGMTLLVLWQAMQEPERASASSTQPRATAAETAQTIEAVLDAAAEYAAAEQWGRAAAVLREAVRTHPEEPELRMMYGNVLRVRDQLDDAYEQYAQAARLSGDHEHAFMAGLAANMTGQTERALEHFQTARADQPSSARYAFHVGLMEHRLGERSAARASFSIARELEPEMAEAWGMLAQLALDEGSPKMALHYIERARKLQPDADGWRIVEARGYAAERDYDRALRLIDTVDRNTILADRGLLSRVKGWAAAAGEAGFAADLFAEASDHDPEDGDLALEAADLLERVGETDRAKRYAERAVARGIAEAERMLDRLREQG